MPMEDGASLDNFVDRVGCVEEATAQQLASLGVQAPDHPDPISEGTGVDGAPSLGVRADAFVLTRAAMRLYPLIV